MTLRMTVGALLVVMVLAAGSVSAAGWYFTDQLVMPDHSAPRFDIAVHDASSKAVELDETNETLRPGVWGLEWPAGHAIVGAITSISSGSVNRVLVQATAPLGRGLRVAMNSQVYWDDPERSFGIPSQTVDVPSELGSLHDWFVAGSPTDFAIVVHGHNAPITDGMRLVPALVDLGLSILLIRYRNDVGSPPSPDHLLHLGDTEWRISRLPFSGRSLAALSGSCSSASRWEVPWSRYSWKGRASRAASQPWCSTHRCCPGMPS
jgi:hypothetical protein